MLAVRCRPVLRLQVLPVRVLCSPPRQHTCSPVRLQSSGGGWYSSVSQSSAVHLAEDYLVHLQQLSGLPWWLSIAAATVTARTVVTLPLAAYQLIILSRVEGLQQEIRQLADRLRYEVTMRARDVGWTERQCRIQFQKNMRRIVSQLYIRDNCHPFKASLLVWVQLPMWISLSLALRNLSLDQSARHSDLAVGGALWFPDLTTPDSTWIIPVCLGLTNLLIIEIFSLQRREASRVQKLVTNAVRGFSVLMVPVAATVPASMALYWWVSSLVGLCQNLLLRSPAVTRMLGVKAPDSPTPYRDLLAALHHRFFQRKT
ncbi:cytochrome c oxidase assembly protein COX18, mitochondrial [Synchiropus splendidus]|uniref:cytochrome c oxidase assembly protein COX18, mitochondrial n=1 Tax=Synchiropus splendidus TaxID=270530 RepID=UPI00237E314C|nr:cytochrome c oxidase assembly protein COX18, mitochondrial [Synchiropus splendidus]